MSHARSSGGAASIDDGWVDLVAEDAVPIGEHVFVEAEGIRLLVHRLAEGWFVTSSECPHQEFTMDRCVLRGPIITCTEHGWRFDVRTGACVAIGDPEDRLPTWPAELRGGRVWAKLF
jgi:nitrite reductase/ring-hydroxylating ferredoxin subunit